MPTTRAQEKAAASANAEKKSTATETISTNEDAPPPKKRQRKEAESKGSGKWPQPELTPEPTPEPTQEETIKASSDEKHGSTDQTSLSSSSNSRITKLISTYGQLPLETFKLPSPLEPSSKNILALLLNSMLTSTRISHSIANKTIDLILQNNYHDLSILSQTTWQERTKLLTDGGYTHYRERTATQLGELAELISSEYNGDLNEIPEQQDGKTREAVHKALEQVKGIGPVGLQIFMNSAQAYWTFLAPCLDQRSLDTAKKMGLVGDAQGGDVKNQHNTDEDDNSDQAGDRGEDRVVVEALWKAVGEDPVNMARLANAITIVRLEGKEDEFL